MMLLLRFSATHQQAQVEVQQQLGQLPHEACGCSMQHVSVSCPYCRERFPSQAYLGAHKKKCRQAAEDEAGALEVDSSGSPSPVKSRRLRGCFQPTGHALQERYEDRIRLAAQDSKVFPPAAGLGDTFSSHFALDATAQDEQEAEEIAADTAGVEEPRSEDATKEEVIHALRIVVLEIGDKGGDRQANAVINLLQHQSFEASLLRIGFESIQEMRQQAGEDAKCWLADLNFKQQTIYDPKNRNVYGVGWFRSPVDSLKRQFAKASSHQVFFDPFIETNRANVRVYNHTMGCALMENVVPLIKDFIINGDGGGFWIDNHSFVGAIQTYSDKSCQTLKVGSHSFLPFHICPLNMTQTIRQELISKGDTIVAYFPVEFVRAVSDVGNSTGDEEEDWWREEEEHPVAMPERVSAQERRLSKSRVFQASINEALLPLWNVSRTGIVVSDGEGNVRKCHPVLASYVADMPEASDVGGTLHGHCPRGYSAKLDLASDEPCIPRDILDTVQRLNEFEVAEQACDTARKKALQENMRLVGVTTIRPALFKWPFMDLTKDLALPRLLRFETLHNFFLGLSRTLKVCASEMLKDPLLSTTELLNSKGGPRKLKSARVDVLKRCNAFLRRIQAESPCVGLKFDFTKAGTNDELSGFFTSTGIVAMLEAKDLAGIDQVMPFVFALLDRLCGTITRSPFTTVCVLYQELVATATSRFSEPGFTALELDALAEQISIFQNKAIEVFGKYQASGMAFPKFHALRHLVSDIKMCGSLSNYSADSYEASHKLFKTAYDKTSKRKDTRQEETMRRLVLAQGAQDASARSMSTRMLPLREDVVAKLMGKRRRKESLAKNQQEMVREDAAGLSGGGDIMMWGEISAHAGSCSSRRQHSNELGAKIVVEELCEDVGGPGRLQWYIDSIQEQHRPLDESVVRRPATACVAGLPCPTLKDCEAPENGAGDFEILSMDNGDREMQRAVSSHSYYSSKVARQDNVMIEESGDNPPGSTGGTVPRRVYIAKVLAFLAIKIPRRGHLLVEASAKREDTEICLIRYYDCVPAEEIDAVDRALNCVKLRWSVRGEDETVSPGESAREAETSTEMADLAYIDVQYVGSIRGLLHIVRCDDELRGTKSHPSLIGGGWETQRFYINRFKQPMRKMRYSTADKLDVRPHDS